MTRFSGQLIPYFSSFLLCLSLLFTVSLQAYGAEKTSDSIAKIDSHHLVSSNQQPVMFEKSATRGVRQENSSEGSSSDPFVPFLGSLWEFHYLNSDNESIGELIGTFTFDSATHTTEDGETELYAISDNKTRCDSGSCTLTYHGTSSSYYGLIGLHEDINWTGNTWEGHMDYEIIGGHASAFSFSCVTPTCDTVTGIDDEWFWEGSVFNETEPDYEFAIIGQRLSTSSPPDQTNIPSNNTLPSLGSTAALDVNGTAISTETTCSGGISINGGNYQTQVVQNLADKVDILGHMTVDPSHVGQSVDIFVYAEATLPSSEEVSYFTLGQGLNILPWDQDRAHLAAFQPDVILDATQVVPIYQGTFFYPGTLKVYFGYRLKDGTVVTHDQALDITINQ